MKKEITTRQLIIMLVISLFALKVLLLPNLMARNMQRDIYIFLFLLCMLDFGVLFVLLKLMQKYPDKTFSEIIKQAFGEHISRIIMLLLMLFFFAKCCGVFQSCYVYLNENLYSTYSWLTYSLPILIVLIMVLNNGIMAFARLAEMCFAILVIGFGAASFVGLIRADFTNLLPILENGASKFASLPTFAFWFGDYLVLIPFFGRVNIGKDFVKKTTISVFVAIVAITVFYMVAYARYSYNIIGHTNSISDILQVQPSSSDIGNFDWVLILIWDICLFLYFALNLICASYSFQSAFVKMKQTYVSIILCVAIFLVNYFLQFNIYIFVNLAQENLLYYSIAIEYVLPLIVFFGTNYRKRRKNEVSTA